MKAMIHIKRSYRPVEQFSLDDINQQLANGQLNGQEFAWMEGYDWQPLNSLLVALSAPASLPGKHSHFEPATPLSDLVYSKNEISHTQQLFNVTPSSPCNPPSKASRKYSLNFEDYWYRGIALFFLGIGLYCLWNDYSFLHNYSTATGILNSTPSPHTSGTRKHRRTEYFVRYTFTVNGRNYSGTDEVDAHPPTHLTIYYNRSDPTINRAEYPKVWIGWSLVGLGAVFCIVFFKH